MNSKSTAFFSALLFILSIPVDARFVFPERDGRAIYLYPRRFDQQNPELLTELANACDGTVCGTISGQAVSPLLANADECAQQHMADQIIDSATQFDPVTQAKMIDIAIKYRQLEKNTPPDFTFNPPKNRNSVFCQEAPKHSQLDGLVQGQDPANDPQAFFDPKLGKTVLKGSQPNTFPFGTQRSVSTSDASSSSTTTSKDTTEPSVDNMSSSPNHGMNPSSDKKMSSKHNTTNKMSHKSSSKMNTTHKMNDNITSSSQTSDSEAMDACPQPVTVTVTRTLATSTSTSTPCPEPITITVTRGSTSASATRTAAPSSTSNEANLQTFKGVLGAVTPPPVTAIGGGLFQVIGNAQFNSLQNALVRSCDVQHNQCANKANSTGNKGDLTVEACGNQQQDCDNNAKAS